MSSSSKMEIPNVSNDTKDNPVEDASEDENIEEAFNAGMLVVKIKEGHTVKAKNISCDICCDFLWFAVKFAVKAPQRGAMGPLVLIY